MGLQIFFFILNVFGCIGSAIWLATLGDWVTLGLGLVIICFVSFAFDWVMMMGLPLGLGAFYFWEKSWRVSAYFLLLLYNLYVTAVIALWNVGVLAFFNARATHDTLIPLLIWSYGVATGAITFLAHKDGGEAAVMSAFFAQIGFILMMTMIYFFHAPVMDLAVAFISVMIFPLIFNFATFFEQQRQKRSRIVP
jgi:hypothetical protein